jgi:thiol-disulfide isomerase/thioredoxin
MKSLALVLSFTLLAAPAAAQALKPWPGGATPALELSDLEGARHRLADYRGKVVLVNFWATWCEPCREEMPSIERLRASLEGRPFAVLAVNLAEPESRIRKFLDTVPGRYTVLLDRDGQAARAWQARMLPATYIVGLDGRIRYRHVGDTDWARAEVRDLVQGLMK